MARAASCSPIFVRTGMMCLRNDTGVAGATEWEATGATSATMD